MAQAFFNTEARVACRAVPDDRQEAMCRPMLAGKPAYETVRIKQCVLMFVNQKAKKAGAG
jgi:hypothetical protein